MIHLLTGSTIEPVELAIATEMRALALRQAAESLLAMRPVSAVWQAEERLQGEISVCGRRLDGCGPLGGRETSSGEKGSEDESAGEHGAR